MISRYTQARAPDGVLTERQVRAFRRDGYVIVPGLFGLAEIEQISTWVEEVQNWEETPGRHMMYFEQTEEPHPRRILNRVENVLPFHHEVKALAASENMQGACSRETIYSSQLHCRRSSTRRRDIFRFFDAPSFRIK